MFATKWKLTALAMLTMVAAAGAVVAVTASARPASPNASRLFVPVEKATKGLPRGTAQGAAKASRHPAPARPETYGVSPATLDAIAQCESGGDPTAVSADGTYRGLYQFDESTWQSVGGAGDPAAASPAEQTMRAAILYSRAGSSPWPICGQ